MTIMVWVFSAIAIGASVVATLARRFRQTVLAIWIAGLGTGAIFLTLGAEFLAIVQWIVCTLVAISFVFFAVLFGEYQGEEAVALRKRIVPVAAALVVGGAFAITFGYATLSLPDQSGELPAASADLAALGKSLTQDHLPSLEALGLTLFLVLIGGGVIARPEHADAAPEDSMENSAENSIAEATGNAPENPPGNATEARP